MYKFDDTTILDQKPFSTGCYVLAHSQDCEDQRRTGYSIRYYAGCTFVDPWSDDYDNHVDFADQEEGLLGLANFDEADRNALYDWLSAQI